MRLRTWLALVVLLGSGCIVVEKRHPAHPHPHPFRHHRLVEVAGTQDRLSR
jgi:hypothetical protein